MEKCLVKFLVSLFFLLVSEAALGANDGVQAVPLAHFSGANTDLKIKLRCLRTVSYPKDIESCGLAGFDDKAYQKKIEECFSSQSGEVLPLKVAPNGQPRKIMLVVQCRKITVSAVFDEDNGKFLLTDIGELVD
jgi:hypothetical protein